MKYICNVCVKGDYDYPVKYEFSSDDEMRLFLKNMSGVLWCKEAYCCD